MIPSPAIRLEQLTKTYGRGDEAVTALDAVDLSVEAGTVFGLLGANGSGKSTLIRVLSTLTRPTDGRAYVHGVDVATAPARVRGLIGVTAQQVALDDRLSGRENLQVFARLNGLARKHAATTAGDLLELYRLTDAADRPVGTYSGGMRRRLDIVASLVLSPDLLFLDEPTTGLDPRSRNDIWSAVRELAGAGTSVFLTTQYLDEADQLADRVAVLDGGHLIADGTSRSLKARVGRRLSVTLGERGQVSAARDVMLESGAREVAVDGDALSALVDDETDMTLPHILDRFTHAHVAVADIGLHEPTLDEAYLALTGAH